MLDKAPEESENAGLTVSNADHGPALSEPCEDDIIEPRANPNHDPRNGRFTSGGKGGGKRKTKYAPSPQRNKGGIRLGAKKYAKLCGTLNTRYPGLEKGKTKTICDSKNVYSVRADGFGGMTILSRKKL